MNKKIAFFDFDGTITTSDSLFKFIKFAVGNIRFFIGLFILSPILVAYKLKLIKNYKAKEYLISWFFKNIDKDKFSKIAKEYSLEQIKSILRPKAIERIEWHKKQGDKIVVVSASIECWLKPWCDKNDLELLATKLKFENGKFLGKFLTKNCHGEEKVTRIKKEYNLDEFSYIYAYGDSKGDLEMLNIANKKYFKPFRNLS